MIQLKLKMGQKVVKNAFLLMFSRNRIFIYLYHYCIQWALCLKLNHWVSDLFITTAVIGLRVLIYYFNSNLFPIWYFDSLRIFWARSQNSEEHLMWWCMRPNTSGIGILYSIFLLCCSSYILFTRSKKLFYPLRNVHNNT